MGRRRLKKTTVEKRKRKKKKSGLLVKRKKKKKKKRKTLRPRPVGPEDIPAQFDPSLHFGALPSTGAITKK